MRDMRIESFQGKWRFLSNFWVAPTLFEGVIYPTAEHAYQSAKSDDKMMRFSIKQCGTPGRAKRLGQKITLREDWEEIKRAVMEKVVRAKFSLNRDLGRQLVNTGKGLLSEGNYWHDNFWGDCWCDDCADIIGQNHLGRILMKIREEL
jgi:N-glycosidase YbiA